MDVCTVPVVMYSRFGVVKYGDGRTITLQPQKWCIAPSETDLSTFFRCYVHNSGDNPYNRHYVKYCMYIHQPLTRVSVMSGRLFAVAQHLIHTCAGVVCG